MNSIVSIKVFLSIVFLIFILAQFKIFSFLTGVSSIFYLIVLLLIFIDNRLYIEKYFSYITFLPLLIIVLIFEYNLIYNSYFQHHILFLLATFFVIRKYKDVNLLNYFNTLAIIYIIVSIVINYILNNYYLTVYDVRILDNRFSFFIHRFIGIEGTPAGPDLLFTLLLILNIKNGIKKNIFYIFIYTLIILWTGSLSNIVALILSLPVFVLPPFLNFIYLVIFTFLLHNIIIYIYTNYDSYRNFLDMITTWRARIYYRIWEHTPINSDFLFGNKGLVQYLHFDNKIEENPHNTYLLYEEKLGIIISLIIYIYIAIKSFFTTDRFNLFIVSFILIYATTNSTILSPRGNPIVIFIFLQSFFKIIDTKDRLYVKKFGS